MAKTIKDNMQNALTNIFRLAVVASLTDREKFVNKTTAIIERFQEDPEKSEKMARFFMNYLREMKDNMNRQQIFENVLSDADLPDNEHLEELTKAIRELTHELQKREG